MDSVSEPQTALVVEADDEMRHLMDWLFEESGYRVIDATSVDHALAWLERHALEVSICFIETCRYVEDGGERFAATIAQRYPWIHLVVSTADERSPRPHKCNGNVAVISQPWRPLDILIHAEMVRESRQNFGGMTH